MLLYPSKLNGYQEKNSEIWDNTVSYDYLDVKEDGKIMWRGLMPGERGD